jgi:hypothetical protein
MLHVQLHNELAGLGVQSYPFPVGLADQRHRGLHRRSLPLLMSGPWLVWWGHQPLDISPQHWLCPPRQSQSHRWPSKGSTSSRTVTESR